MKKILAVIAAVLVLGFLLSGCRPGKVLHCDGCGKEVKVKGSSNMTEDMIILCSECQEKLYKDSPEK